MTETVKYKYVLHNSRLPVLSVDCSFIQIQEAHHITLGFTGEGEISILVLVISIY